MKIKIKFALALIVLLSFVIMPEGQAQKGLDTFINNQASGTVTTVSTGKGFESFVNTATESTVSGGKGFESFITTSTSTENPTSTGGTTTTGVRTPGRSLPNDVYSSAETNTGGSIYTPYDGPVFSGPGLEGGALLAERQLDGNVSKERDVKVLIIGWTNFLLSVAALLAVVALVWAGFLYVTAAGDDGRMETAKKIVIWVVVGILLILAAYAIVNTVMQAAF